MGIPKFFRWISERYPCLSETVKEHQIPEYDNLYLDMNGIIHVCSHPNDDDPHFRITEEEIFSDICKYIRYLFNTIKPRKVFYMAVDGVAPRAKMNQQRGRRFRSARDALNKEEEALKRGETLPEEARFDSNCITPGTPFMVRLDQYLRYWVAKMISTDPLWRGVKVYLSGHEVPGEGEHKIMEFIRHARSQDDYDPNTRHCLYGLDADLIMLGICTHEPRFSLLREEVRFGKSEKNKSRQNNPEDITFYLFHLSLLREYLSYEFSPLKNKVLSFEFDMEKIIDDWVFDQDIRLFPKENGGSSDEKRKKRWVPQGKYVTPQRRAIEEIETKMAGVKLAEKTLAGGGGFDADEDLARLLRSAEEVEDEPDLESPDDLPLIDYFDGDEALNREFRQHKRHYYQEKLGYGAVTQDVLQSQAECYVRAIQWNLHYYYHGVQSWSWYYPHHYSPFITDIRGFCDMDMNLDFGKPFLPFQQLLAVLPAASKTLLPKCYQPLMTDPISPLIRFYPIEFEQDLNGKKQDWEAVVLIPFIDQDSLIREMQKVEHLLTPEEVKRNGHGPIRVYEYAPKDQGPLNNPITSVTDLYHNYAAVSLVPREKMEVPLSKVRNGRLPNVLFTTYFVGFPTLSHIPHKFQLRKDGVKVFQQSSRGENMILEIEERDKSSDVSEFEEYCLKVLKGDIVIHVNWPSLQEANITAISTSSYRYTLDDSNKTLQKTKMGDNHRKIMETQANSIADYQATRYGIDVGDTHVLLQGMVLVGVNPVYGGNGIARSEKVWGTINQPYLWQMSVDDLKVKDPEYSRVKCLEDLYPIGSSVFVVSEAHYGCHGEVVKVKSKPPHTIYVKLTPRKEINLDRFRENYESRFKGRNGEKYYRGYEVGNYIGMSPHLVSRVTGTIYIVPEGVDENSRDKINVGLNLKSNAKNEQVLGYTKREPAQTESQNGQWVYSQTTSDLLMKYQDEFPDLFEFLESNSNQNAFHVEDVFADSDNPSQRLDELKAWLKKSPAAAAPWVSNDTEFLEEDTIRHLMNIVDSSTCNMRNKVVPFSPKELLVLNCVRDTNHTDYQLFDRVTYIKSGQTVPLGLTGTIIGIRTSKLQSGQTSLQYEVLFDEKFPGATAVRSIEERGFVCAGTALLNLSAAQRQGKAQIGRSSRRSAPPEPVRPQSSALSSTPRSAMPPRMPNAQTAPPAAGRGARRQDQERPGFGLSPALIRPEFQQSPPRRETPTSTTTPNPKGALLKRGEEQTLFKNDTPAPINAGKKSMRSLQSCLESAQMLKNFDDFADEYSSPSVPKTSTSSPAVAKAQLLGEDGHKREGDVELRQLWVAAAQGSLDDLKGGGGEGEEMPERTIDGGRERKKEEFVPPPTATTKSAVDPILQSLFRSVAAASGSNQMSPAKVSPGRAEAHVYVPPPLRSAEKEMEKRKRREAGPVERNMKDAEKKCWPAQPPSTTEKKKEGREKRRTVLSSQPPPAGLREEPSGLRAGGGGGKATRPVPPPPANRATAKPPQQGQQMTPGVPIPIQALFQSVASTNTPAVAAVAPPLLASNGAQAVSSPPLLNRPPPSLDALRGQVQFTDHQGRVGIEAMLAAARLHEQQQQYMMNNPPPRINATPQNQSSVLLPTSQANSLFQGSQNLNATASPFVPLQVTRKAQKSTAAPVDPFPPVVRQTPLPRQTAPLQTQPWTAHHIPPQPSGPAPVEKAEAKQRLVVAPKAKKTPKKVRTVQIGTGGTPK
ncbi:unnamed protein product [Cyprideis torosa]|uniref:Uncharacterized protein n=1 Tax=Cyprideis torosa TaxID=163714 RepID=A0A7R8W619_9CRUS|nr:unnamed protein product [Cyprideis torosa]CAG0880861.1 unnamed protein product [Cyprideis torosa]